MPDLRPWSKRGPELQEIARRLRLGETPAVIGRAMGLSSWVAQTKCKEVAAALGIPTEADRRAELDRRVVPLVEEGLTDPEIAGRLGVTYSQVVGSRTRALGPKYSIVRLTPAEHSRVDQMIVDGFSAAEIAAEIGCSTSLVNMRARNVPESEVATTRPPCGCGLPAGHRNGCRVSVPPSLVRDRLLAGQTCADIAREVGRKPSVSFKATYCQPVIDLLTAEGLVCGCGSPFGHKNMCRFTGARQKRQFSEDQRSAARSLVATGASSSAVRQAIGLTAGAALALTLDLRSELASAGASCPCGRPLDHAETCAHRRGDSRGRRRFQFSATIVAAVPPAARRRISRMARTGSNRSIVAKRTGVKPWLVRRMFDELAVASLLPSTCARCGGAAAHAGDCSRRRCACGLAQGHRAACRAPSTTQHTKRQYRPRMPAGVFAQIKAGLRAGDSAGKIAAATGLSRSTISGAIRRLREGSSAPLKRCGCGRPARHPGACVVNAPAHAVTKLEKARIDSAIRAGEPPHRVASRLGLSNDTVLRHSRALREQLFAAGTSCACGRLIGHPEWCAAKWESFDFPSRQRPLPPEKVKVIRTALLKGEAAEDVAAVARVGINRIWAVRRTLTDGERTARARLIRGRLGIGRPHGRKLIELVHNAVPKRLDPSIRDDIVAELHLAVIEGRIEVEQIAAAGKKLMSDALREHLHSRTRSLEESLHASDRGRDLLLGDMLGDRLSVDAAEEIEIGQPPP